jgi:hypothetical protein
MIGLLKKLFGSKPAETTAEVPYKVEAAPVIELVPSPAPAIEAVVKQQPAKKPAPKKQQPAKKPAAPKTAAPKTAAPKPKAPPKPKAKPAV